MLIFLHLRCLTKFEQIDLRSFNQIWVLTRMLRIWLDQTDKLAEDWEKAENDEACQELWDQVAKKILRRNVIGLMRNPREEKLDSHGDWNAKNCSQNTFP